MCVCGRVHMWSEWGCGCGCTRVCMWCVCGRVWAYTCVHVAYVYLHACLCAVCVYVHMYTCVCTHMLTSCPVNCIIGACRADVRGFPYTSDNTKQPIPHNHNSNIPNGDHAADTYIASCAELLQQTTYTIHTVLQLPNTKVCIIGNEQMGSHSTTAAPHVQSIIVQNL